VLYFLHKILNHCNNSIPQIYFCLFHNDLNNVDMRLLLVSFDMLCVPQNHNYGKQKNNISKVSYSIYTNKEIPFFCTKNNIFKNKNCLSNCLDQVLFKILNHCNNSIPQIYFCLFHNDLNNVDMRLLLVSFDMLCVPPHANHV
jgi:hypothetical protein